MKKVWFQISRSVRQAIGYGLIWLGIMVSLILALLASYKFYDVATRSAIEQANSKAQWAVHESDVKVVER